MSATRSFNMSRIRAKDTKPELIVRRILHSMGYRYRLHAPKLPGRPDIVFRPLRKVIFVHGCYWHRHPGCPKTTTPKTRQDFWQAKFERNVQRDRDVMKKLTEMGWSYLVVWECETIDADLLVRRLSTFLAFDRTTCAGV
ncbi:very short patch repair endonuclease [Roseovarius sp. MMSF_3281]|uniref:very short patch repair endonuclease n=1 Tax=Roseovarius sp. MMSF_3281 TaxID=3046694 RepID=UPI00273DDD77|nr:very short patch repair endonuclease [Roseovarius sp. MMSF_3281]